jgi:hypothetical protein
MFSSDCLPVFLSRTQFLPFLHSAFHPYTSLTSLGKKTPLGPLLIPCGYLPHAKVYFRLVPTVLMLKTDQHYCCHAIYLYPNAILNVFFFFCCWLLLNPWCSAHIFYWNISSLIEFASSIFTTGDVQKYGISVPWRVTAP